MLLISLREGDYVMIGDDIRVSYDQLKGRDHLVLAIDAPRDVSIQRGKIYEENIKKMAEEGDSSAAELSGKLKKEYTDRARKAGIKRSRREDQERRVASGEIKPYHQNAAGEAPKKPRKASGSPLS